MDVDWAAVVWLFCASVCWAARMAAASLSSFSFFLRASITRSMASLRSFSGMRASSWRESCRWMDSVYGTRRSSFFERSESCS